MDREDERASELVGIGPGERSAETLARIFRLFATNEAPQLDSPLYEELCLGIAGDAALLELAAQTQPGQPPPNVLLAAVHYLLLGGVEHPLAAHYPDVCGGAPQGPPAFPAFRSFCLEQRARIVPLLRTRLTQTNVIQRCIALLPGFAAARAGEERPLALVEVGASAGLNLNWDRYHYAYPAGGGGPAQTWGEPASPVRLTTEVRGEVPLPLLPARLPVAWRAGIDLRPVDPADADAVTWLRALIWPEHVERHARLEAAVAVARAHPPRLLRGDARERLPGLLDEAPREALLCVFATHALYQLDREGRLTLLRTLQAHARERERTVLFLSQEGTARTHSELTLTRYTPEGRETRKLADCNPHGRWIAWLPGLACLLLLAASLLATVPLPAQAQAQAEALPETIRRVRPSVVAIGTVHPARHPRMRLAGSGFIVGDGTRALTCHHVVEPLAPARGKEWLAVFVGAGREAQARRARLVASDRDHDVALLAFEGPPGPALRLGTSGAVEEGRAVAFTGYPVATVYGLHPVTHRGIVSAVTPIAIPQLSTRLLDAEMLRRLKNPFRVYQLDATAYPGDSGSPVYDPATGEVLAIVSSVFVKESKEKLLSDPSGITFAVPIAHARELLAALDEADDADAPEEAP